MSWSSGAAWWRVLVLVLCTLAPCPARLLQQQQPQSHTFRVSTAAELKIAILKKAQRVVLTQNITLSEELFPEPPATCLEGNPTTEIFKACAPASVVYEVAADAVDRKAVWSADPGVVLDARFLFRGIVVARPVDLVRVALAQIVDDHSPFFLLFGALTEGPVTYRDCTFLSPCGPNGVAHIVNSINTAFPLATILSPTAQPLAPRGHHYDAVMRFPIVGPNTAQLIVLSSDVICYDVLRNAFAPREAPSTWLLGSDTVAVRDSDECQRPETYGADYRGVVGTTIDGEQCRGWNDQAPRRHTMTALRLPQYGLGSHAYCRNPDRSESGVWCFTNSGRAPCAVPQCPPGAADTRGYEEDDTEGEGNSEIAGLSEGVFWGLMLALLLAVLAVIALVVWLVCLRVRSLQCDSTEHSMHVQTKQWVLNHNVATRDDGKTEAGPYRTLKSLDNGEQGPGDVR